jgi:hypothetical protein
VRLVTALGLEIGEPLTATPFGALHVTVTALALHLLAASLMLHARHALLTTAATLRLTVSSATTADLSLALAAMLRFGLALAATLRLCLTTTAALDLRVPAMAALFGLCRSWRGNRHCCDTCCKDELPHRKFSFVPRQNGPVTDAFHLLRDEKGLASGGLA